MGWDGHGRESSPRMLPYSPSQDGLASAADSAGMDYTKTPRAPSLASRGQLRPRLRVPVDKQIFLPVQNLAAVLLAWLGTGAWSVLAGAALQLRYLARQEHEPKGFPGDKRF